MITLHFHLCILLRTYCCRHKCFPVFPRAQHLLRTQILRPGHWKRFLILFRNVLCPQQMFPSLRSMETQHSFCVPRDCAHKKHHEQQWQQCVRNNVSSFARAFTLSYTNLRYWQTRTHCCRHKGFPVCPQRATFVADTNFVSGTQKCFWFCSETLCIRNKCFPVCARKETSWATMFPQQCVLVFHRLKLKKINPIFIFIATPRETVFQPEMCFLYLRYAVTTTCHGSVVFSTAMPWSESGTEPRDWCGREYGITNRIKARA